MTDLALADHAVRSDVAAVAENLTTLVRTFNRARARMLAAAGDDVEWSAHILLKRLSLDGSMRAGALAECLGSDPSTISRQVAALVRDGLLERRADPVDGRASLLVLTGKARELLVDHDRIRVDYFADMLAHWDRDDLARFAAMLSRFTADFDNTHETIAERIARTSAPAGGTT